MLPNHPLLSGTVHDRWSNLKAQHRAHRLSTACVPEQCILRVQRAVTQVAVSGPGLALLAVTPASNNISLQLPAPQTEHIITQPL